MKRFALPLLVLVLLAVVGAVVWVSSSTSERSASRGATESADAALAPGADLAAGAKDAQGELAAPDLDEAARAAQSSSESGATAGDRMHILGRIRAPSSSAQDAVASGDADIEVFALARAATIEELFAAIDPRPVSEAASGDASRTRDTEAAKLVVARARAERNGDEARFDLALPKGTRKSFVIFAGRSWFLREALPVTLQSGGASVVLQAERGAWIVGAIDVPAGSETQARDLEGDVARLRLAQVGFQGPRGARRNERRARITSRSFELRAVDPLAAYELVLEPKSFATVQQSAGELTAGRESRVKVALTRGGAIRGVVSTTSGVPVANASVEARLTDPLFGFNDRTVRTSTSAADGGFVLDAVAAGKVQVTARSKGWLDGDPAKVDVSEGAAITGVVVQLSEGKSIAGLVTWEDGTPAAGADITVSIDRAQAFVANAQAGGRNGRPRGGAGGGNGGGPDPRFATDGQGRFQATGLGDGPFVVVAEALPESERAAAEKESKDLQRKRLHRARAEGVKAGADDVALALAPPVGVRGIVKDTNGAPIQSFVVVAQIAGQGAGANFGGGRGPDARLREETHDDQGRFFLVGMREGKWRVTVSADDFVTSEAVEVTIPRPSREPDLVFQLALGATVTGFVKSPQGAPVAGASVTIASPDQGQQMPWMRGGGNTADEPKAQSDGEGHFVLAGLKAGKLALTAESKHWAKSAEVEVEVAVGKPSDGTILFVRDGGRIVGEVYDAGRPAASRSVQATEMQAFAQKSATTDAQGRFLMEHVEAGSWRVTVMPSPLDAPAADAQAGDGGGGGPGALFARMKTASVDVADGEEAHVVLGAPPEDPVVVHGRVTHGGEPVAGVNVSFSVQGGGFGPGGKRAQSGQDGVYSITLDKPGEYVASLQTAGGGGGRGGPGGGMGRQNVIEFPLTVPSQKDVVLDFALPNGRISGRVSDPDGAPATGVRVSLRPDAQVPGTTFGGQMNELTTDDDGRFDIQSLRAGSYTVLAGGPTMGALFSGQDATVGREMKNGVRLSDGEWIRDCNFKLHKAAAVQVEVLDESAGAAAGATVFARDDAGRLVDRVSTVRTDSNGIAKFGGLAPGRYSFSARKDGLASGESARVTVSEGGGGSVRITLSKGTLLYVKTVDANDAVVRTSVTVVDEGGREVSGMIGVGDMVQAFARGGSGNGEQKVGPLAPGTYRLRVAAVDGRSMERSVTLAGQADRHMTLSFPK